MARAFVSIGSNIDPESNVLAAVRLLDGAVRVVAVSSIYRTEPVGRAGQPAFLNGVVEIETALSPAALKYEVLRRIEAELGRQRSTDKYAPRPIDLDLLLYDDLVLSTPELTLPDPEIARRPFLAIPLAELAPGLLLPGSGQSLAIIATIHTPHAMELRRDITARVKTLASG